MRVIIDENAWSDLNSIALRIGRDNATAARQEVEKIRHVIGLLGELPALSRERSRERNLGTSCARWAVCDRV